MRSTGQSRAGHDPPDGWRQQLTVGQATVGLAVPPCTVALCDLVQDAIQLSRSPSLQPVREFLIQYPDTRYMAAGVITAACFCAWQRGRALLPLVAPLARLRLGHLDLDGARLRYPFYRELMLVHTRMLRISPAELAAGMRIRRWEAWYLYHSPGVVPRRELLERLVHVMMVPLEWLERRGDYGPENTVRRLERYNELGEADLWSRSVIASAGAPVRADAVAAIEQRLRTEMSREGGRHA